MYLSALQNHSGRVTKGMGVVRQIEARETDKHDRPIHVVCVESITVETE